MAAKDEGAKLSLQEQVGVIFKSVFQKQVALKPKVFGRIKEAMKANLHDIIYDSLKRAVRRQASLTTLELCDLLYAIQKRGEKYKQKIGKTLATANSFSDYGQKKMMINYNDDEMDQLDDQAQK